jgi:hypothetical protein
MCCQVLTDLAVDMEKQANATSEVTQQVISVNANNKRGRGGKQPKIQAQKKKLINTMNKY